MPREPFENGRLLGDFSEHMNVSTALPPLRRAVDLIEARGSNRLEIDRGRQRHRYRLDR